MPIIIDDVITGVLVNAIAVAGRRLSVAAGEVRDRKGAGDLELARWFETFRLTEAVPDLPELSPAVSDKLAAILGGNEVQAALHELLAARLSDAAELYAAPARDALARTLRTADPGAAATLTDYYDDQICALVARLEAENSPVLAQIRSEALATRMISVLHAIERHTAALTARPDQRTEASFLDGYRRHVTDRHGRLEPPDFQRRRRVPIRDIYVPAKIFEDFHPERAVVPAPGIPTIDVWRLAGLIDRSVLLGDPGGGKTTAANVLMHHFASVPSGQVPFLVTLRDFAAKDPPERSVAGHIGYTLETLYQCPPPPGLVDLLLLTARAVVIFDGLDELLDTSRRADVSARVEQFCVEYPLAPVLVTSRLIGYDQARLDERQFTCYRLGGFEEKQVADYARKWFALAAGAQPGDAEAFLAESASVFDLRSNPLLLSLMCILYRGVGSLPQDRDEIYEKCTDLLIRDWDDYRRIRRELRAGRQVKPALRHLAWWLFTRPDGATAVTERQLISATAEFLRGSFESPDDARDAAREFVEFCHGRMWVFTDAGTTAAGERLYGFTHRTFLEYFAAAHVAYASDTPEQLAATLAPRISMGEWPVVTELAVQIKDRTSSSGAERVYAALLGDGKRQTGEERAKVLQFLARCLRSVDPSLQRARELTRRLIEESIEAENTLNPASGLGNKGDSGFLLPTKEWQDAIVALLRNCGSYRDAVAGEIAAAVAASVQAAPANSIRVAASLPDVFQSINAYGEDQRAFWAERSAALIRANAAAAVTAAESSAYVRTRVIECGLITTGQALEMPGGLNVLMRSANSYFAGWGARPYLQRLFQAVARGIAGLRPPRRHR